MGGSINEMNKKKELIVPKNNSCNMNPLIWESERKF